MVNSEVSDVNPLKRPKSLHFLAIRLHIAVSAPHLLLDDVIKLCLQLEAKRSCVFIMVGNLTASDIIIGSISGDPRGETAIAGRLDGFHPRTHIAQSLTRSHDGLTNAGGSLVSRTFRGLFDVVFFFLVLAGSAFFIAVLALATPFVVGVSAVLGMMGIAPDYRWRAVVPA